ncbi:unnamed protein product [Rhizophagus irregularis]|nr:unnamed protein product [Rhizophagus irregularis]
MIQKFKSPLTNRYENAQNMINKLIELKDQESGWIIHTRLDPFDNRLMMKQLKVMNDNPPVCLFSDTDSALTNAIMSKLPRTYHFLCIDFSHTRKFTKKFSSRFLEDDWLI